MSTREEFEKWFLNQLQEASQNKDKDVKKCLEYYKSWIERGWQACAAHYEAELLKRDAVIAQKDAALREIRMSLDPSDDFIGEKLMVEHIDDALSIQPDNCRLVAVGKATSNETEQWCIADLELEDGTHTLYTIVQEGVE